MRSKTFGSGSPRRASLRFIAAPLLLLLTATIVRAQPAADSAALGDADSPAPGDAMIDGWLTARTARIERAIAADLRPRDATRQAQHRAEYLFMLGLDPLPARTPLGATVTGRHEGDGFIVENLHYQSIPGLYVTANLWRPADSPPGTRHPAIVYVSGHSGRGRSGR